MKPSAELGRYLTGTYIVVFDERSDASQTRFEGRERIC